MSINNKQYYGGEVIGAGGYGCIFNPPLKCVNYKPSANKEITKLMIKKNVKEEEELILFFKNILKKIPNYDDYFLLKNIYSCNIKPLTDNDLLNFDKKCTPLIKHGITSRNINYNLDKIKALNMPFGGIDINNYLNTHTYIINSPNELVNFNNCLINLLIRGIIKMNNLHIYHGDIKSSNVLLNIENNHLYMRIIDWGISYYDNLDNQQINPLVKRSFQFNSPLSIIIFNNQFIDTYNNLLKTPNLTDYKIKQFINDFIYKYIQKRKGHIEFIEYIINSFNIKISTKIKTYFYSIKNNFNYNKVLFYIIIEYIFKILKKFTKHKYFYVYDYYKNFFLNIQDIWGFITIYYDLYELYNKNIQYLTYNQILIHKFIKNLLLKFYVNPFLINKDIYILFKNLSHLNSLILKDQDIKCPKGKEFNPFTKRCNKKCKTGYYRDKNFKCVLTQKMKQICPKGKDFNPFTKRCNKKCKIGYYRNKTFKCVKI